MGFLIPCCRARNCCTSWDLWKHQNSQISTPLKTNSRGLHLPTMPGAQAAHPVPVDLFDKSEPRFTPNSSHFLRCRRGWFRKKMEKVHIHTCCKNGLDNTWHCFEFDLDLILWFHVISTFVRTRLSRVWLLHPCAAPSMCGDAPLISRDSGGKTQQVPSHLFGGLLQ